MGWNNKNKYNKKIHFNVKITWLDWFIWWLSYVAME